MRLLAIERELSTLDPQRCRDLLREEAAGVWELKKREVIRDIWFTSPGRQAVIMLECRSEAEARTHLATLALVREGLVAFDVIPLSAYDGFERLFGPAGDGRGSTAGGVGEGEPPSPAGGGAGVGPGVHWPPRGAPR